MKRLYTAVLLSISLSGLTGCGGSKEQTPPFVGGADTTPNVFSFSTKTDVERQTFHLSDTITITGIDTLTPISIEGGEYQIENGAFTQTAGTITNNQRVTIRLKSSSDFSTSTQARITIGSISAEFKLVTELQDDTPSAITFSPKSNVPINTLVSSNSVIVSDINTVIPITIENGEYSIDGSDFTNEDGHVSEGQSLVVRQLSAKSHLTNNQTRIFIGDSEFEFGTRTEPYILFFAKDNRHGNELRGSNLSENSTALIADLNQEIEPVNYGTSVNSLVSYQNKVFFCRDNILASYDENTQLYAEYPQLKLEQCRSLEVYLDKLLVRNVQTNGTDFMVRTTELRQIDLANMTTAHFMTEKNEYYELDSLTSATTRTIVAEYDNYLLVTESTMDDIILPEETLKKLSNDGTYTTLFNSAYFGEFNGRSISHNRFYFKIDSSPNLYLTDGFETKNITSTVNIDMEWAIEHDGKLFSFDVNNRSNLVYIDDNENINTLDIGYPIVELISVDNTFYVVVDVNNVREIRSVNLQDNTSTQVLEFESTQYKVQTANDFMLVDTGNRLCKIASGTQTTIIDEYDEELVFHGVLANEVYYSHEPNTLTRIGQLDDAGVSLVTPQISNNSIYVENNNIYMTGFDEQFGYELWQLKQDELIAQRVTDDKYPKTYTATLGLKDPSLHFVANKTLVVSTSGIWQKNTVDKKITEKLFDFNDLNLYLIKSVSTDKFLYLLMSDEQNRRVLLRSNGGSLNQVYSFSSDYRNWDDLKVINQNNVLILDVDDEIYDASYAIFNEPLSVLHELLELKDTKIESYSFEEGLSFIVSKNDENNVYQVLPDGKLRNIFSNNTDIKLLQGFNSAQVFISSFNKSDGLYTIYSIDEQSGVLTSEASFSAAQINCDSEICKTNIKGIFSYQSKLNFIADTGVFNIDDNDQMPIFMLQADENDQVIRINESDGQLYIVLTNATYKFDNGEFVNVATYSNEKIHNIVVIQEKLFLFMQSGIWVEQGNDVVLLVNAAELGTYNSRKLVNYYELPLFNYQVIDGKLVVSAAHIWVIDGSKDSVIKLSNDLLITSQFNSLH